MLHIDVEFLQFREALFQKCVFLGFIPFVSDIFGGLHLKWLNISIKIQITGDDGTMDSFMFIHVNSVDLLLRCSTFEWKKNGE